MAPQKKRDKFKEWLSGFFPSKSQISGGAGSVLKNAHHIAVNNANVTSVGGDQNNNINTVNSNTVFNIQGDHVTVTQIMSLLAQHIIQGAAHNSSARTPPPRCHPNTRVKLIARITTWFEGQDLQELLLWITGPAGAGKSAIVQTFAEYLSKSKSLGASVFISRPNKRNNPNGIFITIAYELATRIEAYRNYIAERISLDPELLRRDMEAQFAAFIVEPFVERKIGASGKRWGILLDGLDELQGEDAQCNIIHLISKFTREHRDAPLAWIIASRPESHISNTFEDDEVSRSRWTEYIPIDSTEACTDVERFLRSSFEAIQKKYRHSVQSDWPSNTDFLKLTVAASGLFVYAQVVMEFIGDPYQGDPASRFEILIAVIDRSDAVPTKENPFVHLDALYHEILSSISSALWPAAKILFGHTIYEQQLYRYPFREPLGFGTLKGMSILFNFGQNTIYASLIKCRSTLKIPHWKAAHKETLTFLHASFADYLKDSSRSAEFHVGDVNDIKRAIAQNIVDRWKKCSGDDVAPESVETTWLQYCSSLDNKVPSSTVAKFHSTLFYDIVNSVARFARIAFYHRNVKMYELANLYELLLLDVHMSKLCYCLLPEPLAGFVRYEHVGLSSDNMKLCRNELLGSLKFGHLDWKAMSPAKAYEGRMGKVFNKRWILNRPRSSAELEVFVSELEDIQRDSPQFDVVVFGGVPSGRVVVFVYEAENKLDIHYVIPYPE